MRLRDFGIAERTAEEISKLGNTPQKIANLLGCPTRLVRYWLDGIYTPSAYYLRRFHELGCDVIYILTGNRSGGVTDV